MSFNGGVPPGFNLIPTRTGLGVLPGFLQFAVEQGYFLIRRAAGEQVVFFHFVNAVETFAAIRRFEFWQFRKISILLMPPFKFAFVTLHAPSVSACLQRISFVAGEHRQLVSQSQASQNPICQRGTQFSNTDGDSRAASAFSLRE